MITKLVNAITDYFTGVEVTSSMSTESKYLNARGVKIRISDHFSDVLKQYPVQVIIPKTPKYFVIVCGYNTFVNSSFNKTKDFLINYILQQISLGPLTENRVENQGNRIHQLEEIVATQKTKIDNQASEINQLKTASKIKTIDQDIVKRYEELEARHKRQTEDYVRLQELQAALKGDIKSKDRDLQEAAELIEQLNTPEYREMIYNNKTHKKYYLDNFPEETRRFIEELIKSDYDRV